MDSNKLWMILGALALFVSTGCISQIQNDGADFAKAIETAACLEKATESGECVEPDQSFYLDEEDGAAAEYQPKLESHEQKLRDVHSDVL